MIFLKQPLILLNEMPAEILEIMLIFSQLLYLSINTWIFMSSSAIYLYLVFLIFFDFSSDIFQEMLSSFFKVLILIYVLTFIMSYFSEAIHIELSYKRCEISVFEVDG